MEYHTDHNDHPAGGEIPDYIPDDMIHEHMRAKTNGGLPALDPRLVLDASSILLIWQAGFTVGAARTLETQGTYTDTEVAQRAAALVLATLGSQEKLADVVTRMNEALSVMQGIPLDDDDPDDGVPAGA